MNEENIDKKQIMINLIYFIMREYNIKLEDIVIRIISEEKEK